MQVSELRKILRSSGDPLVEFEHTGRRAQITGYTVERNVDGTTKAIVLKTGDYEK